MAGRGVVVDVIINNNTHWCLTALLRAFLKHNHHCLGMGITGRNGGLIWANLKQTHTFGTLRGLGGSV